MFYLRGTYQTVYEKLKNKTLLYKCPLTFFFPKGSSLQSILISCCSLGTLTVNMFGVSNKSKVVKMYVHTYTHHIKTR